MEDNGDPVRQAMTNRQPAAATNSLGRLNDILLASLMVLASAGEVEAACRLAGQACAVSGEAIARPGPDTTPCCIV